MKDLEKIKSEDLGCQVQDANPGNFAIEQEVAQLVGATVPAPTEPSADDARELGAQLLVFLRRALTPIQTALRTAVAAIYAHLDSRCTDYTPAAYAPFRILPYDPMTTPRVPRSVANLLTALTAFSDRKISGVPEAADGVSLANLLGSSARSEITEITDQTKGWNYTKSNLVGTLKSLFPSLDKVTLGMGKITNGATICTGTTGISELNVPELEEVSGQYYTTGLVEDIEIERFHAPKVTKFRSTALTNSTETGWFKNLPDLEEIILGDEADGVDFDFSLAGNVHNCFACKCSNLKKVVINSKRFCMALNWGMPLFYQSPIEELELGNLEYQYGHNMGSTSKLLKLSIKSANCNLDFAGWNPDAETIAHQDFLPNFKNYIALRLAQQPEGNPNDLTLKLSQAVFDTIWNQDGTPKSTDPDSVIYQINKIIKTDKHWSVNRA